MGTKKMNEYAGNLYTKLEAVLANLKNSNSEIIVKSEESFKAVVAILKRLKSFILHYDFENNTEEIHFFKEIKPKFYSLLIYHVKIFNIETERPTGSNEIQGQYFQRELNRLTHFFDNNVEFYRYFRSDATHLDEKYFLRGPQDIRLSIDACYYDADPKFSTSHDYKVAKILANEMLTVYLNNAFQQLQEKQNGEIPAGAKTEIAWTASKAGMVELLYGLHSVGAVNHGRLSLKELAAFIEGVFHVSLGEYYRTFLEIRIRKKNRTSFIDQMREMLLKRMDEADENPKLS